MAKDILGPGAIEQMDKNGIAALDQPLAKQGMIEIGTGFLDAGEPVCLRCRAAPQIDVLRKNEPHPVAALVALAKLGERLFVHAIGLGIDEPLQAERIVVGHASA